MLSKVCSKCKLDKASTEYHKSKTSKTGLQSYCKGCINSKAYAAEYRAKNKDKAKSNSAEYYVNNKEKFSEASKVYYINNREKLREKGKKHYDDNKSLYLGYSRTRKAMLKSRVPVWLTDEDFCSIRNYYVEAKRLSDTTGVLYHVDHIIPLCGKVVSGFHAPNNLQIITAEENLKKGSKYNV